MRTSRPALSDSERRYRALVELSADFYWEQDENHRFVYRQGAVLDVLDLPPREDYGKTRWDLDIVNMSEADWDAHRALLDRREEFRDLLLGRRLADGSVYWAKISGRPQYDAGGRFVGYHGVGRNVTREVLAEEALRASEAGIRAAHAALQDAIESAPAAIVLYDAADRLITCNSRFRALFPPDADFIRPGIDFGTLIRRFTESGLVIRPQRLGEAWFEERLRAHRSPSGPLELELADGRWLQIVETKTANGGITTVYTDITALKEREDALRRLNEDLERKVAERTAALAASNRELEAFSSSVSHDLRAPLRRIDAFSALIAENLGADADADTLALLERIRAGVRNMWSLIEELLNLAKVSRGAFHPERIDLSAMAQEIARDLQQEAPQRRVDWRIEPGLAATGDPTLLRIALANLLGNAWKYTRDTPAARIEFGAEPNAGATRYYVRDNGAGFDMAYAARLFEAFTRLHSPAEFEGTGLGLATVQRVVTRHGGTIFGEGSPGAGATFRFTLGGGA